MQESSSFHSIKELLNFFKNTSQKLFYIGRIYCNSPLDLHTHFPNFQIITCYDPYNSRFPFVKVPHSFESGHKCTSAVQCQALLLKDGQVINYMKSRSAKPNVIYMMINQQCELLCKQNGLNFWGPSNQTYSLLGNKVKIINILKQAQIPFIPNICSKVNSYDHLQQLASNFGTKQLALQCENGVSGIGTYFIFNQQDYRLNCTKIENGQQYKIMPYKKLKSFGISAVVGRFGVVLGPIHAQVIGHPKLTPYPGGFCANEHRKDFFQDQAIQRKVRSEILDITKRFGNYLYKNGIFEGIFGIDFVVDLQDYNVYFMEINPRLTGSTTISFQLYQAEGIQFPHLLFHCLQFINIDLNLDVQKFNRQWENLRYYESAACHIAIKPFTQEQINLPYDSTIPPGIWKYQNKQIKFTGKFTYKVRQMACNQFFLLPNHGFAKANIILANQCQEYNCKLKSEIQQLIDQVLKLINSYANKIK